MTALQHFSRPSLLRRGIVIDKERGNFLKVDKHKYTRKVFHGLREIPTTMKDNLYNKKVYSFKEDEFTNIGSSDSLIGIV